MVAGVGDPGRIAPSGCHPRMALRTAGVRSASYECGGRQLARLELLVSRDDVEQAVGGEVPRQQAGGSPRHLRPQVGALVHGRGGHVHQFSPQVWVGVDLDESEGDGPFDLGGQPPHPVDLHRRAEDVFAGDAGLGRARRLPLPGRRVPHRCRTARLRQRRSPAPVPRRWLGGRWCGRSRSRALRRDRVLDDLPHGIDV